MCKQKCVICGKENGCKTVQQAANCSARTIAILLLACLLFFASCESQQEPAKNAKLTGLSEAQVLEIVEKGTKEGKEYLITKHGDGEEATFEVQVINVHPGSISN